MAWHCIALNTKCSKTPPARKSGNGILYLVQEQEDQRGLLFGGHIRIKRENEYNRMEERNPKHKIPLHLHSISIHPSERRQVICGKISSPRLTRFAASISARSITSNRSNRCYNTLSSSTVNTLRENTVHLYLYLYHFSQLSIPTFGVDISQLFEAVR